MTTLEIDGSDVKATSKWANRYRMGLTGSVA